MIGQVFVLGEFGVVGKATANSLLPAATGHKQGDQAAKTKPPSGKLLADSGSDPNGGFLDPKLRSAKQFGLLRRFSRRRNLPIRHPIPIADLPVFSGFFEL
ncbi:MAG: hypothetical protein ACP5XB_30295 [Isosphaeraceae bacterium]